MRDFLRILVVALLGYGLYTYFVQHELDIPEDLEGTDSPTRCVQRLDQAGDRVARAVRHFSNSPVDLEDWGTTYDQLDQRLSIASAACNCSADACFRGREALNELRGLIVAMNDEHTTMKKPLFNAQQRLEDFRRVWEEAKALNR